METMNDNQLNSLKRLKDISRIIEATLQQNNRIKSILASELYFRKKCEASIETIKNNTDEQECYRKVSKMKPKSVLAKELDEELAEYDKYNPHLVDLRKKLVDKLANLKEQYLQAQEAIEKEASQAN
ncbi:conserved Plasmodium protein, unknown function [Plasmodium chabaudi chabaudi]|uniref:Mediator of RNA polymerase II transcription subunit 11 n=1 Tax=Plasmodium chabaudi chabaudi TaxID=31271 RepID=A0A1C6YIW0_PLACU|nr:conserved Plasmodium protein, unknown function [Plasmodium chabaudi chabaudi]